MKIKYRSIKINAFYRDIATFQYSHRQVFENDHLKIKEMQLYATSLDLIVFRPVKCCFICFSFPTKGDLVSLPCLMTRENYTNPRADAFVFLRVSKFRKPAFPVELANGFFLQADVLLS